MAHVLIVDDEHPICWSLKKVAEGMGHSAATAASAEEGLEAAAKRSPDAIILDVRLPQMDGLTALGEFRRVAKSAPVVIMTAHGNLHTAVEAVRNEALEYIIKPFDLKTAKSAMERAVRAAATGPSVLATPSAAAPDGMIGTSAAMQEVFRQIALVAPSDACVHITGESGSGKELVARALHRYSGREAKPFLTVNLASLSSTLIESELFGHVRGAFTGADSARMGLLQQAEGGTIFLDEIADAPLSVQVKLLRVLEYGDVTPVGSAEAARVDLRVISATHQNLLARVASGEFRHDLYFRLRTCQIDVPPLRTRRGDVSLLAAHFADALAVRNQLPRRTLSDKFLAELERRSWHGNVRELRNAIEHALIMSRGGPIDTDHLPPPAPQTVAREPDSETAMQNMIREWASKSLNDGATEGEIHARLMQLVETPLFEAAMETRNGQIAAAARSLGLHRITLRKKLSQYGLRGNSDQDTEKLDATDV